MIIYTFAISALGIFGMLFLKVYEVKNKKKAIIGMILSKFDSKVHSRLNDIVFIYDTGKEKLGTFVTQEIPRQSKYLYFLAKKTARQHYDAILPNIRGSRILRRNKDVSAFLKDIAKHKEESGIGRIDDEFTNNQPPTTYNEDQKENQ